MCALNIARPARAARASGPKRQRRRAPGPAAAAPPPLGPAPLAEAPAADAEAPLDPLDDPRALEDEQHEAAEALGNPLDAMLDSIGEMYLELALGTCVPESFLGSDVGVERAPADNTVLVGTPFVNESGAASSAQPMPASAAAASSGDVFGSNVASGIAVVGAMVAEVAAAVAADEAPAASVPPPPAAARPGRRPKGQPLCSFQLPCGSLVYYDVNQSFSAVCGNPAHGRCILTRKGKHAISDRIGRPIGFMLAWLECGPMTASKEEHWRFSDLPLDLSDRVRHREWAKAQTDASSVLMFEQERQRRTGEAEEPEDLAPYIR